MDNDLIDFASILGPPDAQEMLQWAAMQLRLNTYVGAYEPPDAYVTSVRCVVLREGAVLVVRDPTGIHITPGGRREPGETYIETLQREVLEETGWLVTGLQPLAIRHFHHCTPKPDGYLYPYPDFFHLIFAGAATEHRPHRREVGGWELSADFIPINNLLLEELSASDRLLLGAVCAQTYDAQENQYSVN
jgi:ADP-ribose pyrophosphatase YjhB (NUDIX family)